MIIKSCPNGCDPEDRLDIYNFRDDGFKFCPMCGAMLIVEERPDPEMKSGKPMTISEMADSLREIYIPEMRKHIDLHLDFLKQR